MTYEEIKKCAQLRILPGYKEVACASDAEMFWNQEQLAGRR